MAVTVTQTTDSINRVSEVFLNAVLKAKTFDSATGIRQISGTRDKFSMFEMSTDSDIVQAYVTAPTELGTAAVTDSEFTIDKKSINLPVPYDLFKNTEWKDAVANIHNMGIPMEIQVAMVENITDKALAEVESEIWTSNAGQTNDPTGTIDGFIHLMDDKLTAASLTAQILTGGTSFIDPATIQAQLTRLIDVMPVALLADMSTTSLFVSPATEWAYKRSLQLQVNAVQPSENTNFGGVQLVVIPNLNPQWIALGKADNLGVGLPSSPSDIISLDVIDQKENLKNQANIFGNFGYGAGIVTTDWVISSVV